MRHWCAPASRAVPASLGQFFPGRDKHCLRNLLAHHLAQPGDPASPDAVLILPEQCRALFSMEPLTSTVLAWLLCGERLGMLAGLGFLLLFSAMGLLVGSRERQ
jgi:hypothetical protein